MRHQLSTMSDGNGFSREESDSCERDKEIQLLHTSVISDILRIDNLQENPLENPQVKPLTGELKGFYRLRIGN